MAYDAHKNFAYSTVLTAPSPRDTGTSLVVQAADGAKFPVASFNATAWPPGQLPLSGNSEIVRVTAISTDTFTITRAQESTTAKSIDAGWQIAASITAKTLTDIENQSFNAYKFSVYRNAAQNTASASFTKVNFDTKLFDTGSNFDATTNFRFTAPVAGFYQFSWGVNTAASSTDLVTSLYKNGTTFRWGLEAFPSTNNSSIGTAFVQAAANDFFEIFVFYNAVAALQVGSAPIKVFFDGYLVSLT